jgi:hypothetical protein
MSDGDSDVRGSTEAVHNIQCEVGLPHSLARATCGSACLEEIQALRARVSALAAELVCGNLVPVVACLTATGSTISLLTSSGRCIASFLIIWLHKNSHGTQHNCYIHCVQEQASQLRTAMLRLLQRDGFTLDFGTASNGPAANVASDDAAAADKPRCQMALPNIHAPGRGTSSGGHAARVMAAEAVDDLAQQPVSAAQTQHTHEQVRTGPSEHARERASAACMGCSRHIATSIVL